MSQTNLSPRAEHALSQRYREIRTQSERLCQPLEAEDYLVQSMPDASPAKWHIAHVTWFFETFLLIPHWPGYRLFQAQFQYLFNSYYNAVGPQFKRPQRGLLSRPTVAQIMDYRRYVDTAMLDFLADGPNPELESVIELGLHHEQQHQELLLMDIKHAFFHNPLYPAYLPARPRAERDLATLSWTDFDGGEYMLGAGPEAGFTFDNEKPRHAALLQPFALANRLITNGEYLAFMQAGGYDNSMLWLSDGWTMAQEKQWRAPLYWLEQDDQWLEFTLHGLAPIDLTAPVCHISLYEADAYATWVGARLPTETEWERAAANRNNDDRAFDATVLHPTAVLERQGLQQMIGGLWQWTRSAYQPYPGFSAAHGALGEYNGKFMCNQMVMRGGCCTTPQHHIRSTYRNFFYPHMRWQFGGIRLARGQG